MNVSIFLQYFYNFFYFYFLGRKYNEQIPEDCITRETESSIKHLSILLPIANQKNKLIIILNQIIINQI